MPTDKYSLHSSSRKIFFAIGRGYYKNKQTNKQTNTVTNQNAELWHPLSMATSTTHSHTQGSENIAEEGTGTL